MLPSKTREHGPYRRPVAGRHEADRVRREARLLQTLPHRLRDGERGTEALGAGAQDGGIAGLETERARIRRHVGAALEDHPDDTERRRHTLDLQAIRPLEPGEHAADRIGQLGNALDGLGNGFEALGVQNEAIDERAALPLVPRIRQVLGVGSQDRPLMRPDADGHGAQSGVLLLGARECHALRCNASAAAEIGHQRVDIAAFDHLQGIHPSPAPLKHRTQKWIPLSGFIRCVFSCLAHRADPEGRVSEKWTRFSARCARLRPMPCRPGESSRCVRDSRECLRSRGSDGR